MGPLPQCAAAQVTKGFDTDIQDVLSTLQQ